MQPQTVPSPQMQRTEKQTKEGFFMMYLELSKNYINKHYNGNKKEAIKAKDGIVFDDEKVKKAFSDGWNGFFRHKENNKQYCYFVKL